MTKTMSCTIDCWMNSCGWTMTKSRDAWGFRKDELCAFWEAVFAMPLVEEH